MASVKTTSTTEPWFEMIPYLLGGHLLAPPRTDNWKSQFAEHMMPLLMNPPPTRQPKKRQDPSLLGGGL